MTEHEFNTIFHKYRMHIFNFINKLIKDRNAAEDVTSTVFIKLWELNPILETDLNTKAWLFITAKSKAFDYLKSLRRRALYEKKAIYNIEVELLQEEASYGDVHIEVMSQIVEMIKSYTTQERIIFNLHFIESLKPRDIAKILKSKPQTVNNQLTTIRNKIKAQIKTGQ